MDAFKQEMYSTLRNDLVDGDGDAIFPSSSVEILREGK